MIRAPSTLYLPDVVSRGSGRVALPAGDWLSLGAAPTFAVMAALTGVLGGGGHDMLCAAVASHWSALNGMVPMYVLMSAVHLGPWLKLIRRWRNGACAAGRTQTR